MDAETRFRNRWEQYSSTRFWLSRKGNKLAYASALGTYLDFLGEQDPDKALMLGDATWHTRSLMDYIDSVKVSPNSAKTYQAIIASWYKRNLVQLGQVEYVRAYPTRPHRVVRLEEVAKIVDYADLRTKAVTLILYQSGARITSVTRLNFGHVHEGLEKGLDPLPLRFSEDMTKYNVRYTTFISTEAIEALKTYLAWRRKGTHKIDPEILLDETPLFVKYLQGGASNRITYDSALGSLKTACYKAGIERGGNETLGNHSFRGAFQHNLQTAGVNQFMIEKLMGHLVDHTVAGRYSRGITEDELREAYLKADWSLRPTAKNIRRVEENSESKMMGLYNIIVELQKRLDVIEGKRDPN